MKRPDGLQNDDGFRFGETGGGFLHLLVVLIAVEIGGTLGGSTASHM